jgi:hypothetical protein
VRAPIDSIAAPPFPRDLNWINVASLRMDKQRGRPVLIEFFDVCRVASMLTLPYLQAWHERYAERGLRVISVHAPGFPASRDEDAVRGAVARLGIEHPVLLDSQFELWRAYDNEGWPARYLFDGAGMLFEFHYGPGAYAETERAVQELLEITGEDVLAPLLPQDADDAMVVVPTQEQPGAYSGPYQAGGVWAVLSGAGTVTANGRAMAVDGIGAYRLLEHEHHTEEDLALEIGDGVECHATVFTPGLAPA